METICYNCKKPLLIELTAQFASRVDPMVKQLYMANIERTKQMAKSQGGILGGMMNLGAGMAQSMQGVATRSIELLEQYPPLIQILRCMNCGVMLSVHLPEQSRS